MNFDGSGKVKEVLKKDVINSTGVKYILDKFYKNGVDDLQIKKEDRKITIGYFEAYPVDCIYIENNYITHIVFSRQEKLNWLYELYDNKTEIVDDYFC